MARHGFAVRDWASWQTCLFFPVQDELGIGSWACWFSTKVQAIRLSLCKLKRGKLDETLAPKSLLIIRNTYFFLFIVFI